MLNNDYIKMDSLLILFLKLLFIAHVSFAFNVQEPMQASVCGAGPAGLLTAVCLCQKFNYCQVNVYDKRPTPAFDSNGWEDLSSFYNIGLGERGISALMEFGAWDSVKKSSIHVPGRMDWTPGSSKPHTKMLTDRKYGTYVLPRDKLVSVLHEHVKEHYSDRINLFYEHDIQPMEEGEGENDDEQVRIQVSNLASNERLVMNCDLVVACDGAARTFVREFEMEDRTRKKKNPLSIVRLDDENQRVFKSIHFRLPPTWQTNLNYAVRTANDRLIFDALPVNSEGDYVGILLFHSDDEMANQVEPEIFRRFLHEQIPQFNEYICKQEVEKAAGSRASSLPTFRYVTPRLHRGQNCVILGDSAKTVKPYFGLGCNSALEDVKIFGECLDDTSSIAEAVSDFSSRRAKDIEVLVTLSASLDKPGLGGLFGFIFPLILDGIFHKLAPQIFSQNVIAMLQREDITFQEAADRKRIDRIVQIGFLSLLMAIMPTILGSLSFGYTATALR